MHVIPPLAAVSVAPLTAHCPDVTAHVTEPVPCPPVVVRSWFDPVWNVASLEMEKPDCDPFVTVMVAFDDNAWE